MELDHIEAIKQAVIAASAWPSVDVRGSGEIATRRLCGVRLKACGYVDTST